MHNKDLHKRFLCNIVPIPMTEQKEMKIDNMNTPIDIAVEVHHGAVIISRITLAKNNTQNRYPSTLEIDRNMEEVLLPNTIHALDMTTIKELLDPIVPLIDHLDHITDEILSTGLDQFQIQETIIFHNYFFP